MCKGVLRVWDDRVSGDVDVLPGEDRRPVAILRETSCRRTRIACPIGWGVNTLVDRIAVSVAQRVDVPILSLVRGVISCGDRLWVIGVVEGDQPDADCSFTRRRICRNQERHKTRLINR